MLQAGRSTRKAAGEDEVHSWFWGNRAERELFLNRLTQLGQLKDNSQLVEYI